MKKLLLATALLFGTVAIAHYTPAMAQGAGGGGAGGGGAGASGAGGGTGAGGAGAGSDVATPKKGGTTKRDDSPKK